MQGTVPLTLLQSVEFQQTPYADALLLATGVSAAVAVFAFIYTVRYGLRWSYAAFTVMMVGTSLWSFGYALQFATVGLDAKVSWSVVWTGGTVIAPLALLLFALAYTGRSALLTPRIVGAIAVVPLVTLVLLVTNDTHGLLWYEATRVEQNGLQLLRRTFGPWFLVHVVYSYALALAGIALLLWMVVESETRYRGQAGGLLVGALAPVVANVLSLLGLSPGPVDPTPIAFTVSGVAFAFAIFRYQLFDLVPVARDSVIERMRDGFLVLDDHERVVDYNPAAADLMSAADPVGEPVDDVFPVLAGAIDTAGEEPSDTEIVVGEDASQQYFTVQRTPVAGEGFVGQLVTLRDITDRRGVEKRYQELIEHSSDLITVLDEDGYAVYVSPAAKRHLGYDPSKMEGTRPLEFVHPDDREAVAEAFREAVENPGETVRFEHRYRHADGNYRYLESFQRSVLDNPFVEGVVVNSRDVTERRRREEELQRTNERLEEFASVVSHDLRNPLNVAEGYLEVARTDGDETAFEEVSYSLTRMREIIEDVLALARQGETVGETEPVDLRSIVDRTWTNVDTADAALDVEGDLELSADPGRLPNLFENLFRNAVEHAGEDVTVTVGVLEDGAGFYLEDDGPGIPENQRDDVLESGVTTVENGTGFGLAIVRRIADAHGWSLSLSESDSGGARFEFRVDSRRYVPPTEHE